MNVYTYYSPVGGLPAQGSIIERWTESWSAQGFSPVVLDQSHAEKHPHYAAHLAVFRSFPTINPREYELACYLRWLALEAVGGGLMSDYDVMNVSLGQSEIDGRDIVFHERRRVPCLVQASDRGAAEIVKFLISNKPGAVSHWSDMLSLMQGQWPAMDHCTEIGDAGWETAKTIHFAHGACRKYRPGSQKRVVIDAVLGGVK